MILRVRLIVFLSVSVLLSSCFKKDDAVVLPPPGEVQVSQVGMGPDYINQVYFKLATKDTFISEHGSWDLAFETSFNGFHIWINSGNQVLVSRTNSSNFNFITDTIGSKWRWDASSWNKDSTAIGDWVNTNPADPSEVKGVAYNSASGKIEQTEEAIGVFLVDLGPSLNSAERFKKIVFQTVNQYEYKFKYANLDNSDLHEIVMSKEPAYAYTYFSIQHGNKVVYPEPIKPKWDLLFTRYHYDFYQNGNLVPYIVTGVLLNPNGYSVASDSTSDFADIDYNFAKNLTYRSNRDAIGYDWKHIDYQSSSLYVVDPSKNYIIKDNSGYYWKLHFIGFYNDQGIKGYPQFEYQRL